MTTVYADLRDANCGIQDYWDNGRPVLVTEKKLIIERILKYMLAFQKIVMEVV